METINGVPARLPGGISEPGQGYPDKENSYIDPEVRELNNLLLVRIKKLIYIIDSQQYEKHKIKMYHRYALIRLTIEMYRHNLMPQTIDAFYHLTTMFNQMDFDASIVDIVRKKTVLL